MQFASFKQSLLPLFSPLLLFYLLCARHDHFEDSTPAFSARPPLAVFERPQVLAHFRLLRGTSTSPRLET